MNYYDVLLPFPLYSGKMFLYDSTLYIIDALFFVGFFPGQLYIHMCDFFKKIVGICFREHIVQQTSDVSVVYAERLKVLLYL